MDTDSVTMVVKPLRPFAARPRFATIREHVRNAMHATAPSRRAGQSDGKETAHVSSLRRGLVASPRGDYSRGTEVRLVPKIARVSLFPRAATTAGAPK